MSMLRCPRTLSQRLTQLSQHSRTLSTTRIMQSSWTPSPSPPRLPKEEQERFERLQQASTGAFSTPRASATEVSASKPQINQSPQMSINQSPASTPKQTEEQILAARVDAKGKGEELHPNVRRGAPPEFEGETNPTTGEVGGPKNEPLRWGHTGDWSYNGRCTDF